MLFSLSLFLALTLILCCCSRLPGKWSLLIGDLELAACKHAAYMRVFECVCLCVEETVVVCVSIFGLLYATLISGVAYLVLDACHGNLFVGASGWVSRFPVINVAEPLLCFRFTFILIIHIAFMACTQILLFIRICIWDGCFPLLPGTVPASAPVLPPALCLPPRPFAQPLCTS